MKVHGSLGIVGASGFIGGELARRAAESGWQVVGFSRRPRQADATISEWRRWDERPDVAGLDAVANLAGDPIDQRWNEANKQRFRESRVGVVETLMESLRTLDSRPTAFLNGTAVGIYGDRGDELLEETASPGRGYLAELCRDWEKAAEAGRSLGMRVIQCRTGVVLGRGGAAWNKMATVFRYGLGGRLGRGDQWMPWIHVEDLVGGMLHALEKGLEGPVNGTAPEPERNEAFTRKLASALGRPAFMHAPGWALKVGLGGFAEALLASQKAVPAKLQDSGYPFKFPSLEEALDDLVKS